jgi:pimeloyl-ACP methyl ester carboxylesterase
MHLVCRGSGDAVLFIHGIPTSSQLWSGVIDRMCGKHRCFAIDLPGLGNTPEEPYKPGFLDHLAQRIEVLRIQNDIQKWHVVGHDGGSAVAVHYVHAFPQNVSRLALLSPALFPNLKPYYLLECLRKPVIGEVLAPVISPLFWNVAMRRACVNKEGVNQERTMYGRAFSGVQGSWRFMRVLRWGKPSEVLAQVPGILPGIRVPTIIFRGLRDPAIPLSFGLRAQSMIPGCDLVDVDCGHFIPLNRPSFTAERLCAFFQQEVGWKDCKGNVTDGANSGTGSKKPFGWWLEP